MAQTAKKPALKSKNHLVNGDRRRQQLIEATIQTIANEGLSKTTISKVAKSANLSQGIVNFYFENKDHLLLSTLECLSDEYDAAIESAFLENSGSLDILNAIIDVSFDPDIFNRGKICVWFAFISESHAREEYQSICGKHDQQFQQQLITLVSTLIEQQNYTDLNPVAIARGFEGLIEVFWQDFLVHTKQFNRQQAIQTCKDYLVAFFSHSTTVSKSSKQLAEAETSDLLPPWVYSSDAFYKLEKELIFKKEWLLVGHLSNIPKVGDYLTFDGLGERALIIRSSDNEVRAFHNVCRHRGSKVVEAHSGNCPKVLSCPFHGWTYNLDGSLKNIPRAETFSINDKNSIHLVSINLEIWLGFVFINFSDGATPLAQKMASVDHLLKPYQLENLKPLPNTQYRQRRPYNWKIIHDIDNEGYHVPRGHPSLHQLYGDDYADTLEDDIPVSYGRINKKPAKLWSVRQYQNLLPSFEHLPEENQRMWLYISVFPSTVIGLYPDAIEIYMSIPNDSASTDFIGASYALPDDRRETKIARYLTKRINLTTDAEDENFVSWIQEGFKSSVFPEPHLSSLEKGVRHLHKQIQTRIPVARLKNALSTDQIEIMNQQMLNNTVHESDIEPA